MTALIVPNRLEIVYIFFNGYDEYTVRYSVTNYLDIPIPLLSHNT
jgi:hypothetical protein